MNCNYGHYAYLCPKEYDGDYAYLCPTDLSIAPYPVCQEEVIDGIDTLL